MPRPKKTIEEKKHIILKSICHYSAFLKIDEITDDVFKKLLPHVNYDVIPDKDFLSNVRILKHICWDNVGRQKILRLLTRDINLLEKIDIKKYNFSVIELTPILIQHRDLYNELGIDFNNLNGIEAIRLLECDNSLIDKINLRKYTFRKKDVLVMIKKFKSNDNIINQLNLSELDHFNIRTLIVETGVKFIEKLNLDTLKATDWLAILEKRPELLEYCNLLLFEKNDCYLLTQLIKMFPELDYLIDENKNKISALGWESLIMDNLEKYKDICCWDKFTSKNWNNVLRKHPQLSEIKQKYMLF